MVHNELTELEAWMYFLSSDHPGDILKIIKQYPFFQELYQDIIKFRYQPKELITMFSEALRIMDRNAVEYMVDDLKEEMSRIKSEKFGTGKIGFGTFEKGFGITEAES